MYYYNILIYDLMTFILFIRFKCNKIMKLILPQERILHQNME